MLNILDDLNEKKYFDVPQKELNLTLYRANEALANMCREWQPLCTAGSSICSLSRDTQTWRKQGKRKLHESYENDSRTVKVISKFFSFSSLCNLEKIKCSPCLSIILYNPLFD